ncbi:MAG: esterase/lipase family protein [Solirubrobacterales bacterium]
MRTTEEPVRSNVFPIILVPGWRLFGQNQMPPRYWGGLFDIVSALRQNGYQAAWTQPGPFSSNWDRACEVYAQIRGARVDYGAAHSSRTGHDRYGEDFSGRGLYPEWGTACDDSRIIRKIHLIGHSMGGQTGRLLIHLLRAGSQAELRYHDAHPGIPPMSELFDGNRDWAASLSTLSAPHNGSTVISGLVAANPWLQQQIATAAAFQPQFTRMIYDFKLDHWGIHPYSGEAPDRYFQRLFGSRLWTPTLDFSLRDLTPEGAQEMNRWVKTHRGVYYFSWASRSTWTLPTTGQELPSPDALTNPSLLPNTYFMGLFERPFPRPVINHNWLANDGWVNTYSMEGPKLDSPDRIREYDGEIRDGVWNFMGTLRGINHEGLIGFGPYEPVSWYLKQADLLAALPPNPS